MPEGHGYPPPTIEDYSVEAVPAAGPPSVVAEDAAAGDFSLVAKEAAAPSDVSEAEDARPGDFKIVLKGRNFFVRALAPTIHIGSVRVKRFQISPDESSIVCFLQELPEEGAEISISYGPGMTTTLDEKFSRDRLTVTIQDKAVALFPRLIVGLTAAPVPLGPKPPGNPADGKAADIKVLLDHIHARLKTPDQGAASTERPDALRDAWLVQGAHPLPVTFPSGQRIALAEESWARQVSEMLNLAPYGGPGVHYLHDEDQLIATGVDGRDPAHRVYSLIYACQHLATFGVASRGRSKHQFQPFPPLSGLKGLRLINAGSSSAFTVQKTMNGLWVIGGGARPLGPVPDADLDVPQDPRLLGHNPELAKAATLFQITKMQKVQGQGPEFEFGPGTVAVFGNRPALPTRSVETETTSQTPKGPVVTIKREIIINVGDEEIHITEKTSSDKPLKTTEVVTWKILSIKSQSTGLLRDNSAGAHAGFFIRADSGAGKFQVFDTGGFGERNRGAGIDVVGDISGFHSGTFDGVAEDQISSKESFRGVGVWTKMEDADAKALEKHVEENLKRARPLGLARLVIVRAGKKFTNEDINLFFKNKVEPHIIYASPLLRMYDDDDRQNYAISRYIWSLRGVNNAGVDISWWIYIPRGPLAKEMLEQPRTTSINDLADGALKHVEGPDTRKRVAPNGQVNRAIMLAEYTLPIIDVLLDSKGSPRVTYKHPKLQNSDNLHKAERLSLGKINLPMDKEFLKTGEQSAGFPSYFREPAGGGQP